MGKGTVLGSVFTSSISVCFVSCAPQPAPVLTGTSNESSILKHQQHVSMWKSFMYIKWTVNLISWTYSSECTYEHTMKSRSFQFILENVTTHPFHPEMDGPHSNLLPLNWQCILSWLHMHIHLHVSHHKVTYTHRSSCIKHNLNDANKLSIIPPNCLT